MIVCTRTADAVCRQGFGSNNVAVSKLSTMCELFQLDPTLSKPSKEAFIVTSDDLKSPKQKKEFMQAAALKHDSVKICLVVRSGKTDLVEGSGIDKILIKPKAEVLAEAVYELCESIASKLPIDSSADMVPKKVEKYVPQEFEEDKVQVVIEEEEDVADLPIEVVKETEEEVIKENETSTMAERIRECNKVADLNILTSELTAAKLVKDLLKENQEYVSMEEKLKGIQEKIYSIMIDKTIPSLEDKLEKVRALTYDKQYYRGKSNTIIEQRVESIINTITEKTIGLITTRLTQLDQALLHMNAEKSASIDFSRLAGITDERANIILELATMSKEVREIYFHADNLVHDVVSGISENDADLTGNPLINAHLRVRGDTMVSGETMESLIHILSTCERTSAEFQNAVSQVSIMQQKLNRLLDLDKETIAAQTQIIEYLRANKIEDTIIAETLIKKSLRVFVGISGSGRTVVPLTLSQVKSKQNANVLLIDVTGDSKLSDYGVISVNLEDWLNSRIEKELCIVSGSMSNRVESAQRLLVSLVKAADYYKVINIVMTPEQIEIFHVIANDVLCVNYIVDTNAVNVERMGSFIRDTKTENVAQRVILNKCSIDCKPIIERLGLINSLDTNVIKIPYIREIVDCGYSRVKPYEVSAVLEGFREAVKYA